MEIDRYTSLDGQVALVTGATRGIGRAIASGLESLGATVYAGARNPDDVETKGQRAIEPDVTKDGTMRAAIDHIDEEAGRLDVLVNNAGVAGPEAPLHEVGIEGIDATFGVNLRGPVVLTRFALPHLLKRPGGRVVNVSSGMGALGEGMSGGHPPYRVSKAGLNGLTVYLHGEYGDEGLLANAACPGWVRTDLGSAAAPRSPEEGRIRRSGSRPSRPEARPAGSGGITSESTGKRSQRSGRRRSGVGGRGDTPSALTPRT